MSVSSIFSKIDDLERKVASLADVVSQPAQSNAAPQPAAVAAAAGPELEDILRRLAAVEAVVAAFAPPDIDSVNSRLSLLESKALPDDLPMKVDALHADLTNAHNTVTNDIASLVDKLNHLETVTLPHVLTRLENVENRPAGNADE